MKQKKSSNKESSAPIKKETVVPETEALRTGLNEDPEERNIHDAMDDDLYDRAESELDD